MAETMRKQLLFFITISLLSVIILTGCKSKQKITSTILQSPTEVMVSKIYEAEPKFESLEFKRMYISVNLNNKGQYNSNASCKIIKDSIVFISLQPFFGVEMFNLRITPKQLIFVDKIKAVYYPLDYSFIKKVYNIDVTFNDLQALFTNRLFSVGVYDSKEKSLVKSFEKAGDNKLTTKNEMLNQSVSINDNFRIIDVLISSLSNKEHLKVSYENFTSQDNFNFPSNIDLQFKHSNESFNCGLSISKLTVNETLSIPAINLMVYREGDIFTLLK